MSAIRSAGVALAAVWLAAGARPCSAESTLVSAATTGGQEDYRVVHWTTADGLPQGTVTDIVFLPDGTLWLATFGGLVHFDGRTFDVLDMAGDEGMPANRIVSLAMDGRGGLLFLTQQGHLGRVEDGHARLLLPPPLPTVETLELRVDPGGRVLCRSDDGRAWRTDGTHRWEAIPGAGTAKRLQDLAVDEDGEVFGVLGDELVKVVDGQPQAAVTLPEPRIVLSPRAGGGLWLGGAGTVARWTSGRLDMLKIQPPLEAKVVAIEPADEAVLWVATDAGVSRLDRQGDGSWRRTSLPLPPGARRVHTLRFDRAGSLWIGATGAGLYRVNRLPVRRVAAQSGLGEIWALAADDDGGAFAASGCRQLFHVDRSGAVSEVRLPGQAGRSRPMPCGVSLAPGPDDDVWARLGPLLFRVRREPLEARLVTNSLPFDEGPVVSNPDGSVWVASRDGRVQRMSREGALVRELHVLAPLMSAAPGLDGALWIGGEGVVYRLHGRSLRRFGPEENVPRGLVREVLAEADGTVWIGTYGGGVGRLRAGRVARLTALQGLPDNAVSRILDDGRGRLWISTNRGLAVAEKRDLETVADGRAPRLFPVVLGIERGMAEANFGRPAGFADGHGRLWFGTIDGAVSIDAAAFPFDTTPPTVRVSEILADGQPLPLGEKVRIPARTVRLRLGLATPPDLYPDQMTFRFRVEGVDPGWVDAGAARTVDWSPPGPGHYRVLVQARNEDGVWSEAPTAVDLDVRPAWWQTTVFRAALGLAVALVFGAGIRLRIRGIERRHAERVRVLEEQRAADSRVAVLRAQLEHVSRAALAGELAASLAHEVRQPIGAIVNNAEAGRRNLDEYRQRPEELRQVLDDIVADGTRASEVVQGLRSFLSPIHAEAVRFDLSALVRDMLPLVRREVQDNRVKVDLDLAGDLPRVEGLRVQMGQIVVNLVVNACEALAAKDGERRIAISTMARDGHVELVVHDDGPGLAPAIADRIFEPFVTTKPEGLGVGLAICRSIAERHGGHLMADAPPGGGVRMTLTLPAGEPPGFPP